MDAMAGDPRSGESFSDAVRWRKDLQSNTQAARIERNRPGILDGGELSTGGDSMTNGCTSEQGSHLTGAES